MAKANKASPASVIHRKAFHEPPANSPMKRAQEKMTRSAWAKSALAALNHDIPKVPARTAAFSTRLEKVKNAKLNALIRRKFRQSWLISRLSAERRDSDGLRIRNKKARPPEVKDCATRLSPRKMTDKKPKRSRSRDKGYWIVKGMSPRVICPSTLKTCQRRRQDP